MNTSRTRSQSQHSADQVLVTPLHQLRQQERLGQPRAHNLAAADRHLVHLPVLVQALHQQAGTMRQHLVLAQVGAVPLFPVDDLLGLLVDVVNWRLLRDALHEVVGPHHVDAPKEHAVDCLVPELALETELGPPQAGTQGVEYKVE